MGRVLGRCKKPGGEEEEGACSAAPRMDSCSRETYDLWLMARHSTAEREISFVIEMQCNSRARVIPKPSGETKETGCAGGVFLSSYTHCCLF